MIRYIAIATALASPALAERIFPSLPDAYRSGTVELHLAANRADDGGGYGGGYGGPGGGGGGYGIFTSNPTALRMGHVSGGSTGSRTTGNVAGTTGVGVCGCH